MSAEVTGSLAVEVEGVEAEFSASAEASTKSAPHPSTTRSLGHDELKALQRVLASLLAVQGHLELGMRIRSYPVSLSRAQEEAERQEALLARLRGDTDTGPAEDAEVEPPDSPLLNSFIADDLAKVAAAVRAGDHGPALRTYFSSSREVSGIAREDIRSEGDSAAERVFPELTPAGR